MDRLGWQNSTLKERSKNDPAKLAMAARVRRETTMPIKWIADRLQLGTTKGASATLHVWMQQNQTTQSIQAQSMV